MIYWEDETEAKGGGQERASKATWENWSQIVTRQAGFDQLIKIRAIGQLGPPPVVL